MRYYILLSLLIVGMLSGCKGNMNEFGQDVTNRDNLDKRINNVSDKLDRNDNIDRTTRVRYSDRRTDKNTTDKSRFNNKRVRMDRDANRDFTRQGRLAKDNERNQRYVNNRGDLDGFNEPRMRVADRAADRITSLKEVDSATVIVTDNNAYVAAKLNDSSRNKLSKAVERKISDKVKKVDRDIDKVYVSVNPDFFDRMNNYAQDMRQGRPVSGFFEQFTETIQRIFPDNAGR